MTRSAQVASPSTEPSKNSQLDRERSSIRFEATLRRPSAGKTRTCASRPIDRTAASDPTPRLARTSDRSRQQLALALQHTHGFVITVNDRGQVEFISGSIGELLGMKVVQGRSIFGAQLSKGAPELVQRLKDALRERAEDHFEWFNPACQRWIAQHIYPDPSGVTTFGFDLPNQSRPSKRDHRPQEQPESRSNTDFVTGLINRHAFQTLVERACRGQLGQRFSILLVDVDGFKTANDSLGHSTGDRLLTQVARRLRGCVGPSDILGRLGNDEFGILHCDGRTPARPRRLVNTILEAMQEPFLIDSMKVHLTVSIGVAVFPEDGQAQDRMLTAAGIAMNRVKREGGNGWQSFQEAMQVEVDARRAVHDGLLEALAAGQMTMQYQPMVDLRRGLVTGLEALLRWKHPDRGLLSPAQFLDVAEEDGTIIPLGEWTLLTACQEAANWPFNCGVGINLSARQFRSNIVRAVSHALGASQIDPSRVVLEVSDSVFVGQTERSVEALHRLKGLGVKIVLDGFGSGFAPFRSLQLFPFDKIKIDRCLIRELGLSRDTQIIVRSTTALARELGVEVGAQGVETPEQLRHLREFGCHQAQGYLFCRPMPSESALNYLKSCAAGRCGH